MTTHEVLVAARNLIDREGWAHKTPSGWVFERTQSNCTVNTINSALGRFSGWDEAHKLFAATLGLAKPGEVYDWNDTPGRTKEEVLAAFDKAITETAPPPADPFIAGPVGRASFRDKTTA